MRGWLCQRIVAGVCVVAVFASVGAWGQTVTIDLEGIVPVSCRLQYLAAQINIGSVGVPGSKVIPFAVRCNTPFQFAILSQGGALKAPHTGALERDFTSAIPYDLTVQIPTTAGAINGTCASSRLTGEAAGCAFPDSGDGIALQGEASLAIVWNPNKEPVAGTYSDSLIVSILPKI